VYVTVNETNLEGRKEENIVKVRALFVDLDGSPIQPILDLPEDLQPHIIIESSTNRWHAYWLVNNCELTQFTPLQQALAAKFNGDKSVCDLPRVMRLAGFSHNKSKPFITRIHTLQDNLYPYSVNKLIVGLGLELDAQKKQKQTFANANSANPNCSASGRFDTVKRAAQGRWDAILSRLGITLPPHNQHAPCPACGGTDRFRYDNQDGHGTFICGQGGNGILAGDGFALIQHKTGATSSEVLNMVRGIVLPNYQKSEKYQSANANSANSANPDQWSEPLPLLADNEALPYPIDAMPHVLANAIKEVVAYTKCPIVLAGNSALSFASLAAQGLVDVARDSILCSPVSLYLIAIGESGERKSSADKFFSMPIDAWEQSQEIEYKIALKAFKSEKSIFDEKRKGLLSAINKKTEKAQDTSELEHYLKEHDKNEPRAPLKPQFIYQETTPEGLNKGLAKGWPSAGIMADEASIVFGGHGNNTDSIKRNLATLNMYWEDKPVKTNRSDVDNNLSNRNRRLTMGLAAQADMVRDFFAQSKGTARSIGFGARFLIAWPETTAGTRFYTAPPEQMPNLLIYRAKIGELLSYPLVINPDTGGVEVQTLTFSPEAKDVWIAYHNQVEGELGYLGEFKDIKDVASKSADNAARLAALFHVLEHGINGSISALNMQRAVSLAGWHLYEARRFFGQLATNQDTHNAIKLDEWLINHCRKSQESKIKKSLLLTHAPYSVRSKEALDKAIQILTNLSRIRLSIDTKLQYIEVNPVLLEA